MKTKLRHALASRRLLYTAGTIIFIASVAFLFDFVHRNWHAVRAVDFVDPGYVLMSAGLYMICHFSTGLSWPLVLRGIGTSTPLRIGFMIGLIAQVGKYLPGNVAQYFGRAALAVGASVPIKLSGVSTVIEILSTVLAAAIIATAALIADPSSYAQIASHLPKPPVSYVAPVGGLLAVVAFVVLYVVRNGIAVGAVIYPTLCLAVSFLLSASSYAALLWALGSETVAYSSVIAMFTIASLAGFLIPGSPAGLGVREAILIGFVAPQAGAGIAIACALIHRVMTAIIDLLAACGGYYAWMRWKKKKSAKDVLSGSAISQG